MDFATIGRADPVGKIQEWQKNESFFKNQQQQRAVTDLDMRAKQQTLEVKDRAIQTQIEEDKKLDMPQPLEIIKMKFEGGGEEGSAGGYVLNVAKQNGFIDMSQGGEGTITRRNMAALKKTLSSDTDHINKMSRTRIDWGRNKLNQAKEMLAKKPDDQNAQQAFQKASIFLTQALGQDKAFKEKEEKFTLADKQVQFLTAATNKFKSEGYDDVPAQQKALEALESTKKAGKFAPSGSAKNSSGEVAIPEYRQWYKSASSEAMSRIFANKPEKQSEIKIFMDALESGDMETAKETENSLTQSMTDDQYNLYQNNIKEFFNRDGVPKPIREMFKSNVGEQPTQKQPEQQEQELPDPAKYTGNKNTIRYPNGDRFRSDGSGWSKWVNDKWEPING